MDQQGWPSLVSLHFNHHTQDGNTSICARGDILFKKGRHFVRTFQLYPGEPTAGTLTEPHAKVSLYLANTSTCFVKGQMICLYCYLLECPGEEKSNMAIHK